MFEQFEVPKSLMTSDPRFGVGPSLIPENHVHALANVSKSLLGTSHRKPAVRNLCKEVQDGLKKYFAVPDGYEVILGNGGATLLFDMIALGLVKNKSLHYTMGEFSQKWFHAHKSVPWIDAEEISVEYGKGIKPAYKEGYDFICCTLNETSTGVMINSLPVVPAKNETDDVLISVDATSGAGQIPCDISKVDVYFFSPQKVFASDGGFFVCIMSPKALKRAKEISESDTYIPKTMSWDHAISNSLKNQTYNTPAISTIFLLNEQVKLMNKLGEDKVVELAKRKAALLYDWAQSKEYLSCFVSEKDSRSISVATIDVDDKYSVDDLEVMLAKNEVAYDIGSYRKLGRNQLRISTFHNISFEDLEKLIQIISLAIENE